MGQSVQAGFTAMAMVSWCSERLSVVVISESPPLDEQWGVWLEGCSAREARDIRTLVEPHGGAPTPKQRKLLADLCQRLDYRAAVMTDSIVTRGVVTALSWMGVPQRAFSVNRHDEAAAYLEVSPPEMGAMVAELPRLRLELQAKARAERGA